MHTKAEIFNLALSALLLTKQVSNTDSDTGQENKVLNVNWSTALRMALSDMDLDSTSKRQAMELIKADPTPDWHYAYKYPSKCVRFRRLIHFSAGGHHTHRLHKDIRATQIPRQLGNYEDQRVVFTNEQNVWCEIIPVDVPLTMLSAEATLAIAYKLAALSGPLIAGKGYGALKADIREQYKIASADAQRIDREENATFSHEIEDSEWALARLS